MTPTYRVVHSEGQSKTLTHEQFIVLIGKLAWDEWLLNKASSREKNCQFLWWEQAKLVKENFSKKHCLSLGGGASVRRLFNALIYYSVALRIRGDNSRGGL